MKGLQRIGDQSVIRAIKDRIREIQLELAANPERVRLLEEEIDADRAKMAAMLYPARRADEKQQKGAYDRKEIRRRRSLEDD